MTVPPDWVLYRGTVPLGCVLYGRDNPIDVRLTSPKISEAVLNKLDSSNKYLNCFQKLVGGAWVLAVLCSVPQLLIFNTSETLLFSSDEIFVTCQAIFPTWIKPSQYILYFSFANFFIPLLISSCLICKTIWASSSSA